MLKEPNERLVLAQEFLDVFARPVVLWMLCIYEDPIRQFSCDTLVSFEESLAWDSQVFSDRVLTRP